MKIKKIIDNYCRLYGVTMPEIDTGETQYFVTISPTGAGVLSLQTKATRLLGQVVGAAMKRGTVLYVHNGWATPLTWDNWKPMWAKLFASKPRKSPGQEPDPTRPYKSEMFEMMQQECQPKKPQKHGFTRTFIANQSMNQLGHPLFNIRVERVNP